MSDYFVIKREPCDCESHSYTMVTSPTGRSIYQQKVCNNCRGLGFAETQVPLLGVLAKVRWNQLGKYGKNYPPLQFTKLRIVEEGE